MLNLMSKILCFLGAHDWRNGPGYSCIECGKEDDIWKD